MKINETPPPQWLSTNGVKIFYEIGRDAINELSDAGYVRCAQPGEGKNAKKLYKASDINLYLISVSNCEKPKIMKGKK